jgi:hypothetical protein
MRWRLVTVRPQSSTEPVDKSVNEWVVNGKKCLRQADLACVAQVLVTFLINVNNVLCISPSGAWGFPGGLTFRYLTV